MTLAPETIVAVLDFFGVFTSAVAATVLAKRQQLDIFGAVMIAFVASIGGGTTRDLLLNRHPLFWLKDLDYAWTITITSIFTQVFYYQFERLDKPFRWFDALALATFTVIGIEVGQMRGASAPVAVLMGVITAVMGVEAISIYQWLYSQTRTLRPQQRSSRGQCRTMIEP